MIYRKTLYVDNKTANFMEKALRENRDDLDIGKDERIFNESAVFEEPAVTRIMDIQVIGSLENEPCWSQGVLYEEHDKSDIVSQWDEVGMTGAGDYLLGTFTVIDSDSNETFIVTVKRDPITLPSDFAECERGNIWLMSCGGEYQDQVAWFDLGSGNYLHVSICPGNYPGFNVNMIQTTPEEIAAHINKNCVGWFVKKLNLPDDVLETVFVYDGYISELD